MDLRELEITVTLALLLVLALLGVLAWRDNRPMSWAAFGLCVLIPEACSETPSTDALHTIMAVTAVLVVLQLAIDALKQREPDERTADGRRDEFQPRMRDPFHG